ncbi:phosphosulfolactate synthase [Chloroflexota bacterium]
MTKHAFGFLRLRAWPSKPRTAGLFIGSDQALPLRAQEDLLETHSDIIDYAKFTDHAGLASRYSESWFKKKLKLYSRYHVSTFIGGISFELAVLQDKVDDYFGKVKGLGFTAVEVSEDTIPEMPPPQRAATISKARVLGLEVFTEVGRKYPDKPLDAGEAIERIRADLDMGARSVTIEAAETAILKETNPQVLIDIAEAIGLDKIVFECSPPYPWTDAAAWLIKTFGPTINLENISLQECDRVYSMRQGMTQSVDFAFMTETGGKP